ncbi:MAG TPA: glutamate cyclase domain-containing protein [Bacillota bacterium]|nr:glutamate cyclase domain-containing protein [Bacillota bacterium]
MHNAAEKIAEICSRYTTERGMQGTSDWQEFYRAAEQLLNAKKVMIVTGFCIALCGIGENDGPLGSVCLTAALERLGKQVCLVTDPYSETILKNLIELLQLKADLYIHRNSDDIKELLAYLEDFQPNHLIGLERSGRAFDGRAYSMHAVDITDFCPDTDPLFVRAREMQIPISCIGDGGNEVGMGKVSVLIQSQVPKGEIICAAFSADNLLTCGVSNWGGYGLVGILSLLSHQDLLYDDGTDTAVTASMLQSGAVDGVLKQISETTDSFSRMENLSILQEIRTVVHSYLEQST